MRTMVCKCGKMKAHGKWDYPPLTLTDFIKEISKEETDGTAIAIFEFEQCDKCDNSCLWKRRVDAFKTAEERG